MVADLGYQNSCIYKIYKNNKIYIGSSKNIQSRLVKHKSDAKNINSKQYHYKLYKYIRECGGWENMNFEIIEHVKCNTSKELHNIEGQYIKKYGNLNVYVAGRTNKESKKNYYNNNKQKYKDYYKKNKEKYNIKITCTNCKKTILKANMKYHKTSNYCKNNTIF